MGACGMHAGIRRARREGGASTVPWGGGYSRAIGPLLVPPVCHDAKVATPTSVMQSDMPATALLLERSELSASNNPRCPPPASILPRQP